MRYALTDDANKVINLNDKIILSFIIFKILFNINISFDLINKFIKYIE